MRKALIPCVALVIAHLGVAAPASASRPMWPVFEQAGSWNMRSSVNGHVTRFTVRKLHRWGCWSGDLIDLTTVKQAPEDYWGPNIDVIGHQIILHARDGSWRMVGTYTQPRNGAPPWTMQIHGYKGEPTPYVILPAHRTNSDTHTRYYTVVSMDRQVSTCMTRKPPAWGTNVYWRSRFTFHDGSMTARYEENRAEACGRLACQAEYWQYRLGRRGITRLGVFRSAGKPYPLVLTR